MNNLQQTHAITRLTALWALSESGLGGLMHALKIPFTGFFLGGFAIVIITMLAQLSPKPFATIVQATMLVVLIKAAASPHSPPMAYIAVGFQGFIGGVLFQFIPFTRLAAVLFGSIALFESAVQKFLVATLIFGKSIWEALDGFVSAVLKDLSLFYAFSFSFWLIGIYTFVYIIWGGWLGWWASGRLKVLEQKSAPLLLSYNELQVKEVSLISPSKKRNTKLWMTLLVLLGIIIVFVWQGSINKALYVVLRTMAALALLFFVLTPIVKWLMAYWVSKRKTSSAFTDLMDTLPELRSYVKPAMVLAKQSHSGVSVYFAFVENLIILTLYN
jgi:hypothetical protein